MEHSDSINRGWSDLAPDLRAALVVALFVIGLEILSDAVPVVGWLASLPFGIVVYVFQGIAAGAFLRRDARYHRKNPWDFLGIGARSALWTGALSLVVALLTVQALLPVSLGAILVSLPAVLGSSAVDIALNLIFSSLGAILYGLFGGRRASSFACLGSALLAFGCCLFAVGLLVTVFLSAVGVLPHPAIYR